MKSYPWGGAVTNPLPLLPEGTSSYPKDFKDDVVSPQRQKFTCSHLKCLPLKQTTGAKVRDRGPCCDYMQVKT